MGENTVRPNLQQTASRYPTPEEKARRLARAEVSQETPKKEEQQQDSPVKAAPQAATSDEDTAEEVQTFIENNSKEFSKQEQSSLLNMVYKLDPALLRCHRLNKSKGTAKLVKRMKLIVQSQSAEPTPDEL